MDQFSDQLLDHWKSFTKHFEDDNRFVTVAIVASASVGSYVLVQQVKAWSRRKENAKKRNANREASERSIQLMREKCQNVKKSDVDAIVSLSLSELRQSILTSKLRPIQVLRAYQTKALEAHDRTNCVIEFIEEAEQWALQCESTDPAGRTLHGIPISIKEDVSLKGYDSTLGCASRVHKPSPDDSVVLKLMKKHGAIPFVRTNVPQLCLSYEGGNAIYGETRNPHDPKRGSGGSSSGEGAIIGFGASVLGIGSDIGGSIRAPCHFSGVAGFKPTTTRMSTRGADCYCGDNYFQNIIAPTWGPLGRDVDCITSALRILLDGPNMNALDQTIVPLKFNEQVLTDKRSLKIGYYEDNGILTPIPAIRRALNLAKTYLQRQGHTLVEFKIPDVEKSVNFWHGGIFADAGAQIAEYLKDDILDQTLIPMAVVKTPKHLRRLQSYLLQLVNPERAESLRTSIGGGLHDYWDLACKIQAYRQKVSDEWGAMGLDALICPPFALCALPLGNPVVYFSSESYMFPFNTLNYPAGILPMTRITTKDVQDMAQYPTPDDKHQRVKEFMGQTSAVGLPVGLQVVALTYNDEMALNVMKQCEKASDYRK